MKFEDFREAGSYDQEEYIRQEEDCLTMREWRSLGYFWPVLWGQND